MTANITVIDYGASNLLNVVRALEHFDAKVIIADQPEAIANADRLILPGVGAFADGMTSLREKSLIEPLKALCQKGNPFLGICLGMQMMLDSSEEFGHHKGLGLIAGQVIEIPAQGTNGEPHKIPHIGWNELICSEEHGSWDGTIFSKLTPGNSMYFVHSFMANPSDERHRMANCDYDGQSICAAIHSENMIGCQFHPEKSGELGLTIIKEFIDID